MVPEVSLIPPKRMIIRHALLSAAFLLIYLFLNQPAVIFISRLGSVAWYPANGVVLALMLGISPWYVLLVAVADTLAGLSICHARGRATREETRQAAFRRSGKSPTAYLECGRAE